MRRKATFLPIYCWSKLGANQNPSFSTQLLRKSPDLINSVQYNGVSVMYMSFSELTFNVYKHFRTSVC